MKYKITKLCGVDDYSVKLEGKIDSAFTQKILDNLKDFEIKTKSSDSIWLKKGEKNIFIFFYGEIIFDNFSSSEVELIVKSFIGS